MHAENTIYLSRNVAVQSGGVHNRELSGIGVFTRPHRANPHHNMNAPARVTVRPDIARTVRAVSRYAAATKYDAGSFLGGRIIDDSRVSSAKEDLIDLEEASAAQVLDAIARAELRRRIYAPPAARTDVTHETGEDAGKPMRCVAPRRLVARIVPVKRSRSWSGGDSGVRLWRLTFACTLGKLPRACERALLDAAGALAPRRAELQNEIAAARSIAQRRHGGRKVTMKTRAAADVLVHDLERRLAAVNEDLERLVSGDAYRAGIRELARLITSSRELEAEIFGDQS